MFCLILHKLEMRVYDFFERMKGREGCHLIAGGRLEVGSEDESTLVDAFRLHRRYRIVGRAELENETPGSAASMIPRSLAEWEKRKPESEILETLSSLDGAAAAEGLRDVMRKEDGLYDRNRMRPYEDVIPRIMKELGFRRTSEVLSHMSLQENLRILFGDYTTLKNEFLRNIISHLPEGRMREVSRAMCRDVDLVRRLAALLVGLTPAQRAVWLRDHTADELYALSRALPHQLSPSMLYRQLGKAETSQVRQENLFVRTMSATRATARGRRTERYCDVGTWIHIEEQLDGDWGRDLVEVDVLRFRPEDVCVETTAPSASRPALGEVIEELDGRAPLSDEFERFGLFRLSDRVAASGALAGINGGFYFDYGHLDYSQTLGLACERMPGLYFGAPFGWYVHRGVTIQQPFFSRSAFWVDACGASHIGSVTVTCARCNGQGFKWVTRNAAPKSGQVQYFNSIFGRSLNFVPEGSRAWAIASGVVVEAAGAGDTVMIPSMGCVLLLPESLERQLTTGRDAIGTEVEFDVSIGDGQRVVSALACGPQLVRDGELLVDFDEEEFGEKDSPVISFFLPRLVDGYRAARSFVAHDEEGALLVGVVSGRSFGLGRQGSAGMTFGELAVLCQDLGAVDAMALDGGGSSSLVARRSSKIECLNVPTGGSDVPRGHERFVANGLLFVRRSDW